MVMSVLHLLRIEIFNFKANLKAEHCLLFPILKLLKEVLGIDPFHISYEVLYFTIQHTFNLLQLHLSLKFMLNSYTHLPISDLHKCTPSSSAQMLLLCICPLSTLKMLSPYCYLYSFMPFSLSLFLLIATGIQFIVIYLINLCSPQNRFIGHNY